MNVVIDCFKLVKGSGKSIGIYNVALNLVRNLANDGQNDNNYIVLGTKLNRDDFDVDGVTFVEVNNNPLNKLFCIYWELFGVVRWYKKLLGDVILLPRGYTSLFRRMNDIIIVHDLIPFYYDEHYPGFFNKFENYYIMNRLRRSIIDANMVVTISDFSKQDIVKHTGVSESKISVIYNGLNRVSCDEKIKEDYIVAITSGLPHKNAEGIVRSYAAYNAKSDNPLPLTIIGIDSVDKYVLTEDVKARITCRKYIDSDAELHSVISKAIFMMFLSEIEGFGFPPIEAMQLGVPVICSNSSSLPEVTGDAAILVSPHDYDDAADKMLLLQQDSEFRNDLVLKGYQNIKRFNWDHVAQQYVTIFQSPYRQ